MLRRFAYIPSRYSAPTAAFLAVAKGSGGAGSGDHRSEMRSGRDRRLRQVLGMQLPRQVIAGARASEEQPVAGSDRGQWPLRMLKQLEIERRDYDNRHPGRARSPLRSASAGACRYRGIVAGP